jgi:hypothetical protein
LKGLVLSKACAEAEETATITDREYFLREVRGEAKVKVEHCSYKTKIAHTDSSISTDDTDVWFPPTIKERPTKKGRGRTRTFYGGTFI